MKDCRGLSSGVMRARIIYRSINCVNEKERLTVGMNQAVDMLHKAKSSIV